MAGIRKDLAKLAGPWSDEMIWYARAVGEMRTRDMTDRTSWLYIAAIHGFNAPGWQQEGIISSGTQLPSDNEQGFVFNQCQHAGWFFLPWHRGYLAAVETIIADWVSSQGGPADWALPYWNYLNQNNPDARDIPQEFLDPTMPDGSANPLSAASRGGVQVLGPIPQLGLSDINLNAQSIDFYTATAPGSLGYGGPVSGFVQQGNSFGGVEGNPHGPVHVMIGGVTPQFTPLGWMTDPDYAALDPIFWLHHCNIDRLWEAWMQSPANQQETNPIWANGPFPRQFIMPNVGGGADVFTPGDTLPGEALAPTYDNLEDGTGIVVPVPVAAADTEDTIAMSDPTAPAGGRINTTLLGANDQRIEVGGSEQAERLDLSQDETAMASSAAAGGGEAPKLILNLEGIKGNVPTGILQVSIGLPLPDGSVEMVELDSLVLFGLGNATSSEGAHGGNGLTVAIDITDEVSRFRAQQQVDPTSVDVKVSQPQTAEKPITVDRISIYSQAKE